MSSTISNPALTNIQYVSASVRNSRYWPEFLFFTVLVFVMHLAMGTQGNIVHGNFVDTDVYSWLNRVVLLEENGDWFDKTLPNVNPPNGHTQHWSRPFDALLYAGAAVGSPFVGFRAALEYWAVWVSPFLQALTLITLLVALRPVFPRYEDAFPVIALLFLAHNALLQSFAVGRADHQSLLLLCTALALGFTLRMLSNHSHRGWCYAAGLASAFGIWVSVEFMLILGIIQVAFGLYWLREPQYPARKMMHFSLALLAFGSLAAFAHNGPTALGNLARDEISALYLIVFAGSAVFWALAHVFTTRHWLNSWPRQLSFAVCGCTTLAVVVYAVVPDILTGPLGEVDSLYERVRLSRIGEIQPLVSNAKLVSGDFSWLLSRGLPWLGLSIPALFALYHSARKFFREQPTNITRAGILNSVGVAVFIPLTCYQIRWLGYAALLIVPAAAWTVLQILDRLNGKLAGNFGGLARITVIMAFAMGPNATLLLVDDQPAPNLLRTASGSTLAEISQHLGDPDHLGASRLNILAFVDYGPEIVYRTQKHAVFAMPNHRPQPGFIASYAAMSASTDAAALPILEQLGVNLVLVRDHRAELAFYKNADRTETLHSRLVAGRAPPWLSELTLPEGPDSGFRLYRFEPPAQTL